MHVGEDALHKVRVERDLGQRQARLLADGAHRVDDLRRVVVVEQVGHLARVEDVVDVLEEGLLDDLRVGEEEDDLLALLARLESTRLRSSFHSALPYDLVISIWKQSISPIDAARRVSDWRPEPPTPRSSALPSGCRMTREMRATWPTASTNMTSGIFLVLVAL